MVQTELKKLKEMQDKIETTKEIIVCMNYSLLCVMFYVMIYIMFYILCVMLAVFYLLYDLYKSFFAFSLHECPLLHCPNQFS